jgi:lysylphosphatidylglycerol synthetase-like protein (DUF2156 family)
LQTGSIGAAFMAFAMIGAAATIVGTGAIAPAKIEMQLGQELLQSGDAQNAIRMIAGVIAPVAARMGVMIPSAAAETAPSPCNSVNIPACRESFTR